MFILSPFSFRLIQFFVLLIIPLFTHNCDQKIDIPQEIVSFYVQHCNSDYPEKFVETACLKVAKEHGLLYLQQQYKADLSKKNLSKSDAFKQINGFCTTLANVYIHNPFFKQRYTKEQYRTALQEHFSDTNVTADIVLDAYQKDRSAITMDYDKKPYVVYFEDGVQSLAAGLYIICEKERLRSSYGVICSMSVPEAPYLERNLNDVALRSFLSETKEQVGDTFCPNLYSMGIEVVKQQTGLPTSKWGQIETQKVCDFYNSMDAIIFETGARDVRYLKYAEELLLRCISKKIFANTALDRSCGAVAVRHLFQCVLNSCYGEWLVKNFDVTVCSSIKQDYEQAFKQQYDCYSQDGRANVLLSQRQREMDQLILEKDKVVLGMVGSCLFDRAHQLKQTACAHEAQGMLAQRQKLQSGSQEWVVAAEKLEKNRKNVELVLQGGIDMMQLAKQGLCDVDGVGVEYLSQKNNRSLQKSGMQKWMYFVASKKQQRAQADTLAQQNDLVVLKPYFARYYSAIQDKKHQRQLHAVADQLVQKNHGLQHQREQNWLRAMLVGCYQLIKKNSKSHISPETMSNSSVEQVSPVTVFVQQGSSVAAVELDVSVAVPEVGVGATVVGLSNSRVNNPYAPVVFDRTQTLSVASSYRDHYGSEHCCVEQSAPVVITKYVTRDGTHVYQQ